MTSENILATVNDGIGLITFNRPKSLNALNLETLDQLLQVLTNMEQTDDVRVLVLTGSGEKSFVAGADISELATFTTLQIKCVSQKGHEVLKKLEAMPQPVIAAVNGFALGGGLEIALACDFIYASKHAKLGLPEIKLGIIPGYGGTQRLPRLIGRNMAKEMIYTGKLISADTAKEIGLVNKVCPPESLMEEVMATAKGISAKGRVSLRAAKQTINIGMNVDLNSGTQLEENAFAVCFSSEDAQEGTHAFLEKREPEFTGKLK